MEKSLILKIQLNFDKRMNRVRKKNVNGESHRTLYVSPETDFPRCSSGLT